MNNFSFQPTIHYHSKNDKPNAPLALKDFLSHNDKFTENYVLSIIKNSIFFKSQNLIVVDSQSNSEPDIIDLNDSQNCYEVKTFWNEKGCESLSLDRDFVETYQKLNFNEDIEYQFRNWNNLEKYNKSTQKLIEKMNKKKMNYILFMINTFCLDDSSLIPSADIDAKKWQYILQYRNFDFTIYIIKPTLFNKFVIYKISKNKIETDYLDFYDFFSKYITIESISF